MWAALHWVMVFAALGVSITTVSARHGAPEWMSGFNLPGIDGPVNVLGVHDEGLGRGPCLFAAGSFRAPLEDEAIRRG